MSTFNGGPQSIVTNGLVLYLDAANHQSYTRGNTVWNDLSVEKNNGTLTNGPGFSNTNGGSIVFDGADDGISLSNLLPNNSNYTFEILFSPSAYQFTQFQLGQIDFKWRTAGNFPYWNFWTSGGSPQSTLYNTIPSLNTPTLFVAAYNGTSRLIGLNGVTQSPISGTFTPRTPASTVIGSTTTERLFGNLFFIRVYNRALTTTEILQNYNATKGRYRL